MANRKDRHIMDGFAPVFRDQIEPKLTQLEHHRQALNRDGWGRVALASGAGLVVGAILAFQTDLDPFWAGIAVIIGVSGGFGLRKRLAGNWGNRLADVIMPPICAHVGNLNYDRDGGRNFPLEQAKSLGVVGHHDSQKLSHAISGSHRDVPFEMVHALLRKTSGDNNTTVFRGLIFVIRSPIKAPCKILIARDYGRLINSLSGLFKSKGRGMPRVETGHARFEGHLELHAETPEAVAGFLPPGFLDILVDIALSEARHANSLTAAFDRNRFYLALRQSDDFMDYSDLSRSVLNVQSEIKDIFEDITIAHRIIDRLAGDSS